MASAVCFCVCNSPPGCTKEQAAGFSPSCDAQGGIEEQQRCEAEGCRVPGGAPAAGKHRCAARFSVGDEGLKGSLGLECA